VRKYSEILYIENLFFNKNPQITNFAVYGAIIPVKYWSANLGKNICL